MIIIPGKIPYIKKATFRIMCSAGTMIDQHEWVSINHHSSRFGDQYPEPYKNLQVRFELDNNILFESDLSHCIDFEHMFEDSESVTEHSLKITLTGLDDIHRVYLDNVGELAPMMRIDGIWIEHLSMRLVFEDHGQCFYDNTTDPQIPSEFIGQNGTQLLKFSTPIYPWLMSVQKKSDYFY
jgi:hypothetical protein